MKKLFILAVVFLGLVATSKAQMTAATLKSEIKMDKQMGKTGKPDEHKARKELRKLEGNEVSYISNQQFMEDFPMIKPVSSERLDNYDEFDFIKNGNKISAFYDYNAKLVSTLQKRSFKDLPEKSREYISKHFNDYVPVSVLYLDDNESNTTDMILYNDQFASSDSYFVEMSNGFKTIVLQVEMDGLVNYFTRIS